MCLGPKNGLLKWPKNGLELSQVRYSVPLSLTFIQEAVWLRKWKNIKMEKNWIPQWQRNSLRHKPNNKITFSAHCPFSASIDRHITPSCSERRRRRRSGNNPHHTPQGNTLMHHSSHNNIIHVAFANIFCIGIFLNKLQASYLHSRHHESRTWPMNFGAWCR